MGLLDSFERGLERAVNGAFAKTFRSGIQPIEIASALRRELDTKAAIVSRERILAPHNLAVSLSPQDNERMLALGPTLVNELTQILHKHAASQGYSFAGPLAITITEQPDVPTGTIRVASSSAESTVTWEAQLEIDGVEHPVTQARTVVGRGVDADITVNDAGTSRRHVEILWDGERAMVRDLGSTNGVRLDGQRVGDGPLVNGSTITIGRTNMIFRVVPRALPPVPPLPVSDATRALPRQDRDERR